MTDAGREKCTRISVQSVTSKVRQVAGADTVIYLLSMPIVITDNPQETDRLNQAMPHYVIRPVLTAK